MEQELLSEITENFIQELPKNIDKIDEALQGKDLKYLEQILNTFKGTISKIFGLLW
ncbi:MAG TPA: Hpt domain-containing protein [Bacteroidetes bacterium]|nr:Hpt domain-containing protein [Bacteroidota bacterium]